MLYFCFFTFKILCLSGVFSLVKIISARFYLLFTILFIGDPSFWSCPKSGKCSDLNFLVLNLDSALWNLFVFGGLVYEKDILVYLRETPVLDLKITLLLGILKIEGKRFILSVYWLLNRFFVRYMLGWCEKLGFRTFSVIVCFKFLCEMVDVPWEFVA